MKRSTGPTQHGNSQVRSKDPHPGLHPDHICMAHGQRRPSPPKGKLCEWWSRAQQTFSIAAFPSLLCACRLARLQHRAPPADGTSWHDRKTFKCYPMDCKVYKEGGKPRRNVHYTLEGIDSEAAGWADLESMIMRELRQQWQAPAAHQ